MRFIVWGDKDKRVVYGNKNLRWGSPKSYLLEPGDPGYVELQPGEPGYVPPDPSPPKPKHTRKMSELTDADQKAFIDKIIGTLKNADIKALLIEKGWDPTQRTTNLENGKQTVTNDEGIKSQLEAALTTAVATRRTDLDNNYDLASATISSIEGALGKDDPLVKDLRQYRGSLSHASPKKPAGGNG